MKEKMLRAAREKGQIIHKGKPIRLTADLSAQTLQARREWGQSLNKLGIDGTYLKNNKSYLWQTHN